MLTIIESGDRFCKLIEKMVVKVNLVGGHKDESFRAGGATKLLDSKG